MSRIWPSMIGAIAFALPAAPATAASISLAICGGDGARSSIPLNNGGMPADHSCCAGPCHSGCERKSKRGDEPDEPPADA